MPNAIVYFNKSVFNIWLISNIKVQNMRYKCIVFFIVVKCSNILLPSYSRFFFKCLFVSQTLLTTNKSKVNCACLKNPLWMDEVRSSQNTGIARIHIQTVQWQRVHGSGKAGSLIHVYILIINTMKENIPTVCSI